ncbi:hypothetical protein Varpa_2035 [Variovorax paradoxus EPS]|uniref:Uncharacterized protein n=1 Tax=Variovorax paradoxus (strain EPS) TaxID=595537 RepID=E6V9V4_VARPE|nr:hypothetical protein Varpa_2035 [Variovorax paradoxus EPS]
MGKASYHKATVTLKLPSATAPDAELTALRAAGIPVDDLGVPASGYLHMRTTRDYRSHIFRWFAGSGGVGAGGDAMQRVTFPPVDRTCRLFWRDDRP